MRVRTQPGRDEYCVFGSSLGWLCFYGALTFGLRSTGYELVQPLVVLARRLATRHDLLAEGDSAAEGAKAAAPPYTIAPRSGHAPPYTISSSQSSGGTVSFRHADMLTADLSAVPHPSQSVRSRSV